MGDAVTFVMHSFTVLLGNRFDGRQFVLTFSSSRPTTAADMVWFSPETRYLVRWTEPAKAVKRRGAAVDAAIALPIFLDRRLD